MRVVTVSGWLRVPRTRSLTRTFSSPAVIGELTETINRMSAAGPMPPGRHCMGPLNTYRIAFAPSPGARPAFIARAAFGGCGTVGITAAGKNQPPLDDPGGSLVQLSNSLLGVT
jgi:hypothetical protein